MKRFPAEWEKQSQVLLTWPHEETDWAPILSEVEQLYKTLSETLAQHVEVIIACAPSKFNYLTSYFTNLTNRPPFSIRVFKIETNDTWARDHGPITIIENEKYSLLDFTFNAWGSKFTADKDNAININLHAQNAFTLNDVNKDMRSVDYVLEGGAIESDGNGTLMTTEACVLNPNRNGPTSKAETEAFLKSTFGVENIAWVTDGYLAGDDTDSHIDTLARFAPDNTIAYVKCDRTEDEHFEALNRMEACLTSLRNVKGNAYRLIPLPFPDAIYSQDGERLPATYANFLICNQAIFAPTYDVEQDDEALSQLEKAFPGYKIVPINCRPLIEQHGSLHCITMHIPG